MTSIVIARHVALFTVVLVLARLASAAQEPPAAARAAGDATVKRAPSGTDRVGDPSSFLSVKDYGAAGDGKADDTAAIQAAIDAAGKAGATLVFPPGIYVVTSVGLRPGVRYVGHGATIRRPAGQSKWTRTFDAGREGYLYSGDVDSPPLVIEGVTFDGNRTQQGPYAGYELEQAHLLWLTADPSRPGRLRATVRDCRFHDGVADAIGIYTNVDATVANCTARDCFRGGVTVTGGNTRCRIRDVTAEGKVHPTGIDFEVDGAGFGNSSRVDVTIDGLMLPDGDFDVAVLDGSVILGTNILAPRGPFNLSGGGNSTIRLSNSVFGVGEYSSEGNRIVLPGDIVFDNCQFRVDGKSAATTAPRRWAAAHVYWSTGNDRPTPGQSVSFLDCDFRVANEVAEPDTTYAIYAEASRPEDQNVLTVRGGRMSPEFDYGVFLNQGGRAVVAGTAIESATALRLGASDHYGLDVRIAGLRATANRTYMHLVTHTPHSRISHEDVLVDEAANVIGSDYGVVGNVFLGRRVVLGAKPPTAATHGFENDVYRLTKPVGGEPYEWVCTHGGTGAGAEWKPLTRVRE